MSLMDGAQLLGNLGEFIGAIVIVATLIYLAMQVRQNSQHLAAQSRYNYYKGRTDLTLAVAQSGEIAEIMSKARTGEALSSAETMRVGYLQSAIFAFWEYEFREYEDGQIAEEEFNPAGKRAVFERAPDLWHSAWNQHKVTAPRRFVEYINQKVANP